jgi:hypothetical protein
MSGEVSPRRREDDGAPGAAKNTGDAARPGDGREDCAESLAEAQMGEGGRRKEYGRCCVPLFEHHIRNAL